VHRQNLGDMLVAANLIDDVQMQVALAEQSMSGRKFGSTLVDLKFIDENVLAAFLSRQIDVPCISLLHIDIPKKVLRKLAPRVARQCEAIPIRIEDGRLEIAMVDPSDIELIEILEVSTGMTVTPLIAPQSSIAKMVDRFYPDEEPINDPVTSASDPEFRASNPMFLDLIEEIESGDFETRLERIEDSLKRMGTVLERILRNLERN